MEFNPQEPVIICGPNNIGKTNFLRALDLFFSLDKEVFNHDVDIPYHIAEGSVGGGSRSKITVDFVDSQNNTYSITAIYSRRNRQNQIDLRGYKNGKEINERDIKSFMSNFKFVYIQSSNINLPKLISNYFNDEILPGLDRLRRRQTEPLRLLNEFIDKSKEAVQDIERGITDEFHQFTHSIDGVNTSNWKVKVMFPEFEYLREAISNLVTYTLFDSNDRPLDTKGSGIQRLLLLALIKYISKNSSQQVIWALDEPEVFLQPSLQREVFKQLKEMSLEQNIFVTTHSSHFIDLNNLDNTFLFDADHEVKEYARRPGRQFIKVNTKILPVSGYEKIEKIKKHLGIQRNDGWQITPFNILVEGDTDKSYLLSLANWFDIEPPNILVAGGADNFMGYLEFLSNFCEDLDFKPIIVCLLDHDQKGKEIYNRLNSRNRGNIELRPIYVKRLDGFENGRIDYEIEDLIYKEIIFEATNKILRKKQYKTLGKSEFEKRDQQAFREKNILKFLTEMVAQKNSDKDVINFESQSMKLWLCTEACKLIENNYKADELIEKYPIVRDFIAKELFCEEGLAVQ